MVRGRSLVWHSQLPSWVTVINDSTILTAVIQNHISAVAGREALNEDGSMRSSIFYNVLGEAFITVAFEAARAADPFAKLYINDFNLDRINAKVKGLVALVTRINSGATRFIDGIGSDLHLVVRFP
ncbi:glycoside hydrolase superfamily [Collybia nuda]|uniref:Beta-xylanase n=1 Tax=Collybia nuda TaxID=64659 RepID=A0A9P5YCQ8_9AGAR|nr:glycoside hydrolase superfamily [Collybia nuda]